jgi:hypothetical protein
MADDSADSRELELVVQSKPDRRPFRIPGRENANLVRSGACTPGGLGYVTSRFSLCIIRNIRIDKNHFFANV